MQNNLRHDQLSSAENTHRRTHSNNIGYLKGVKAGHRRTMSNTAYDFANIKIPSPPPVSVAEVLGSSKVAPAKKRKGFLSLINAAISYFKQEVRFPIAFPPSEVDSLKDQLEALKATHIDLEKGNMKLVEECEKHQILLENHLKTKKNFDLIVGELKKNCQNLESCLKKIYFDIKTEEKKGQDLVFLVCENEKARISPQSMFFEGGEKKTKKKLFDDDKPTPKPITYKPLTQRGLRGSRDGLKK